MKILSESDVSSLFDPDEAIRLGAEAFKMLSDGRADIPVRTDILRPAFDGVIMVMPGYIDGQLLGLKVNASQREAGTQKLLTTSLVLVFPESDFTPVGLLSSDHLTDYRTAAGLAVGTDALARKNARVHAVFGAGKLAQPSVELIARVRSIERVILVSRTRANVELLAERLHANPALKGCSIETDLAAKEAVAEADVVTAVTTSKVPVFDGAALRAGTHVNIGGAFHPEWREVDDSVASRGLYYMDSEANCLARSGDIVIPLASGVLSPTGCAVRSGRSFWVELPGGRLIPTSRSSNRSATPRRTSFWQLNCSTARPLISA